MNKKNKKASKKDGFIFAVFTVILIIGSSGVYPRSDLPDLAIGKLGNIFGHCGYTRVMVDAF